MAEQAVENVIPPDWLAHNGSYNIEMLAQEKLFVVIEHNVEIKLAMTEMFRDHGNTIIQTDFNYTGMIWGDQNLMSVLNVTNNPNVHFVFIPFKIRKWARKIPQSYFQNNAFYHDALYFNNYLNAITGCRKHQELFGHLNFRFLRVGIEIRCFYGSASDQIKKVKRDICWAVQFEANQKNLNWNVVLNIENCDITLVITVSRKCYMTGVKVRRPQPQIEGMPQGGGMQLLWPFLQAADSVRMLNLHYEGGWANVCTLTFGDAVAAFVPLIKKYRDGTCQVVWVPMAWDRFAIAQLVARNVEAHTDVALTTQVLNVRSFIHKKLCEQNGEDVDAYDPIWIT